MSIEPVPTLSDLKAVGAPGSSISDEVRFMAGRAAAGDPGAGIFEWDALRTDEPNDATVVLPGHYASSSSGRWIRQVDVRGAVHPEWWGVAGDGTTADCNRLKKCFESIRVADVYPQKPSVVFLAKTDLMFICHDATGEEEYDLADWGDGDGDWFQYRIEVAPDASELRVFRSGPPYHEDLIQPVFWATCNQHIPTDDNLGFALRITHGVTASGLLRVDYFQHQVY